MPDPANRLNHDTPRVRFAPSPTGRPHVGNARTALINVLFARKVGAKFLLRIDDTDIARSTAENEAAILADLDWLGFHHDEMDRQSARFAQYDIAAEKLKALGLLYPCFETEEELERRRRIALSRGRPPIYDRAALELTEEQREQLRQSGREPHWRFKLSGQAQIWQDLVRGAQSIDTGSLSDPVLIRADGSYLYTLPSVVDDIELGVSHIIRGEDHVTNSGVQVEIFLALAGDFPQMGHVPLMADAEGGKLSKRLGSLAIEEVRAAGIEPMALLSLLAKIGTSDPVEARSSIEQLVEEFDFSKIGRAPARFDEDELLLVNAKLLHQMPFEAVQARLAHEAGISDADYGAALWLAVRPNLTKFSDVAIWHQIVSGPMQSIVDDAAFCQTARNLLPAEPWGPDSWGAFTKAVSVATGTKGKALFLPLRRALTGRDSGPDMAALLPLIGAKRAAARLAGQA